MGLYCWRRHRLRGLSRRLPIGNVDVIADVLNFARSGLWCVRAANYTLDGPTVESMLRGGRASKGRVLLGRIL
eukprot:3660555-Lingulodinium_polyedra.AAC.1